MAISRLNCFNRNSEATEALIKPKSSIILIAIGALLAIAGLFLLLAALKILPNGMNAISTISGVRGAFGTAIAFLNIGLLLMALGSVLGIPKSHNFEYKEEKGCKSKQALEFLLAQRSATWSSSHPFEVTTDKWEMNGSGIAQKTIFSQGFFPSHAIAQDILRTLGKSEHGNIVYDNTSPRRYPIVTAHGNIQEYDNTPPRRYHIVNDLQALIQDA